MKMKNGRNNYLGLILATAGVGILVVAVLTIWFPWPEQEVSAMVTKKRVRAGTNIYFKDSSAFAMQWCWEFGNGDSLNVRSGRYTYHKPGDYLIRLTVNGNRNLTRYFNVEVTAAPSAVPDNAKLTLLLPDIVFTEESLFFSIPENYKDARWSFGETGKVDRIGNVVQYTYRHPGFYNIKIQSPKGAMLFSRTIHIMKTYDRFTVMEEAYND